MDRDALKCVCARRTTFLEGPAPKEMGEEPAFELVKKDREEDPSTYLVEVKLYLTPDSTRLPDLTNGICEIIRGDTRRVVMHFHQLNQGASMLPLEVSGLVHIVSKLVEMKQELQAKLQGTVIQLKREMDDGSRASYDMFMSMYQPVAPIKIRVGDENASKCIGKMCNGRYSK